VNNTNTQNEVEFLKIIQSAGISLLKPTDANYVAYTKLGLNNWKTAVTTMACD